MLICILIIQFYAYDHSDEIQFVLQFLTDLPRIQDLSAELYALLSVLEDSWHFYRPRPVHVIETLAINQLLKRSFFHLRVGEDHPVMVWHCAASSRELGYDEEVIILGDDVLGYNCPSRNVSSLVPLHLEEPFVGFSIDEDEGKSRTALVIDFLHFLDQGGDQKLLV